MHESTPTRAGDLQTELPQRLSRRNDEELRAGFEAARVANLLHFASLTPDERVEWHTEMFELLEALRGQSPRQSETAGRSSEPAIPEK
ncbi:hypothetical protein RAS1_01430 [Phycisphaerae bacterium RAS1]|nr:hypothetical protein RAS1_01430 [Phycisphaerae bacterium RAS1]